MGNPIKTTISEVKSQLKVSHIISFIVILIIAGLILNFLSKKSALIAKVNPLPVK